MEHGGRGHKVSIISSVHDYRMPRRGSIQAIADALSRAGYEVSFISIRFSYLSRLQKDPRAFLWTRANRFETHNRIRCFLWRTPLHPFGTSSGLMNALLTPAFSLYRWFPNRTFDETLRAAAFVIVESGLGVMLLRRVRALNPAATVIYRASDKLDTINNHPAIQAELERRRDDIDHVCLLAPKMAPDFAWAEGKAFAVPLGVHPPDFEAIGPNPYTADLNAVSVGGMLFDQDFFIEAPKRFPQVAFHVIGSGRHFDAPANVHFYPEMPFKDTLPYIKHATLGIAPYTQSNGAEYLSQSSLKLMQYEYLGIPAVCPHFAAGGSPSRFAYVPGDADTIAKAIDKALAGRHSSKSRTLLTWDEIAQRLLAPANWADTRLAPDAFQDPRKQADVTHI